MTGHCEEEQRGDRTLHIKSNKRRQDKDQGAQPTTESERSQISPHSDSDFIAYWQLGKVTTALSESSLVLCRVSCPVSDIHSFMIMCMGLLAPRSPEYQYVRS